MTNLALLFLTVPLDLISCILMITLRCNWHRVKFTYLQYALINLVLVNKSISTLKIANMHPPETPQTAPGALHPTPPDAHPWPPTGSFLLNWVIIYQLGEFKNIFCIKLLFDIWLKNIFFSDCGLIFRNHIFHGAEDFNLNEVQFIIIFAYGLFSKNVCLM